MAALFAVEVLDEHWVVQLLLLQQDHLLLLGPGVGLHHLDLPFLVVVRSAHLAPVGLLLVILRNYRALVRLTLALLGWHGRHRSL